MKKLLFSSLAVTLLLIARPDVNAQQTTQAKNQVYQAQYAQTIAWLLGLHFTASHPVAEAIQP
jgi:hypothetical protein